MIIYLLPIKETVPINPEGSSSHPAVLNERRLGSAI